MNNYIILSIYIHIGLKHKLLYKFFPCISTEAKGNEKGAEAISKALGVDPTVSVKITVPIDNHMINLWSNWTAKGLDTHMLDFLLN